MLCTVARMWLLLLALLVVGCGGSDTFSRRTSAGCMTLHGARIGSNVDTIARRAGGGAFRARVGVDMATVAFGRSASEGRQLEAAYARVLRRSGRPTKYLLYRNRNAVVLWGQVPGDEIREVVLDCLV